MSPLTLHRLDILAQIGQIADEALQSPDTDRVNVFHAMCKCVGEDGSGYNERIIIAAYALAICEHNLTVQS